jgi:hypothetical protein
MPSKTAAKDIEGEEITGELATTEETRKVTEDIIMGRGEVLDTLDDSPQAAQEQIVRRILAAPDEDAVLAEDSTVATRDLVEVPLMVSAFHLRKSQLVDNDTGEIKEGAYMIVEATNLAEDGANGASFPRRLTLNTGAPKIMAQLIRLQQLELLPAKVMVREVGQAKPGRNRALQLSAA